MKSKKVLAVLMTSVMLLGSLATVGAAADTSASGIDEHLVVHYDFEGLTKEEAMKDKAPAGVAKDNLSVIDHDDVAAASSFIKFDLDNGTVSRTRVKTQLTAAVSEDIRALGDKATVFIRFKLPTLADNYAFLDFYNKTDSSIQTRFKTVGNDMQTKYAGGCRTDSKYLEYQVACDAMRTTENFVNFVVTINMKKVDRGDGSYVGELLYYASVGDINEDTEWYAIGTKSPANNAASLIADTDDLVFTVLGYADGVSGGKTDAVFDDIRIYNTVLSEDDIATIRLGSANGGNAGGNTDSGNTDSGNTDGGNTDAGNTDSGNTNTGNTDNGNTNTDSDKADDKTDGGDETTEKAEDTTAKAEDTTAKAEESKGCGAAIGGTGLVALSGLLALGFTGTKSRRKK